jgi:hypothetical protein
MKKCLTSLVTKQMKIKTLKFYLTPVRRAIIKQTQVRIQQTRNPYSLLKEMQISTTTMESNVEIPQKAKDTSPM